MKMTRPPKKIEVHPPAPAEPEPLDTGREDRHLRIEYENKHLREALRQWRLLSLAAAAINVVLTVALVLK